MDLRQSEAQPLKLHTFFTPELYFIDIFLYSIQLG